MKTAKKENVLFLCTGNSARSQMAEGLLRQLAGDRYAAYSAGLEPKGMNPLAVKAMAEIGIDISGQHSKGIKEYLGRLFAHTLIIVCDHAAKHCPAIWPGMRTRLVWPIPDPAAATGTEEERLQKFREARDELAKLLKAWLAEDKASSLARARANTLKK